MLKGVGEASLFLCRSSVTLRFGNSKVLRPLFLCLGKLTAAIKNPAKYEIRNVLLFFFTAKQYSVTDIHLEILICIDQRLWVKGIVLNWVYHLSRQTKMHDAGYSFLRHACLFSIYYMNKPNWDGTNTMFVTSMRIVK